MEKLKNIFPYPFGIIPFSLYTQYHFVQNKDWIKTILVFVFPYRNKDLESEKFKVAKFAYGKDYHQVIASKLEKVAKELDLKEYQVLVDNSFLDEKLCAVLAGLGSMGRNDLLLTPEFGSFVFLGTIVTASEFSRTETIQPSLCQDCSLCISACPTGALDMQFNKQLCLSYLSQSKSDNYPLYDLMERVVGCDLCLDACPFNQKDHSYLPDLEIDDKAFFDSSFKTLDKNEFKKYYQDKTFNYLGYLKILRNILVLEAKDKLVTREELENYQKKYPEPWFANHLEYLKEKL